jgi:ABC-type multidrug transport system fused ATPase/permease subunit
MNRAMKKELLTSRLHRVSGLSPYILQHCSEAFQLKVGAMSVKLLFTATVSATIMSLAAVLIVIRIWWMFLVLFPVFFGVIFFLDRLIITGRKSNLLIAIRLLAIVVIPLLNVLLFDALAFREDLQQTFHQKRSAEIARMEAAAATRIDVHQNNILSMKRMMTGLADSIARYDHLLNAEVDGTGGSGLRGVSHIAAFKEKTLTQTRRLRTAQMESLEKDMENERGQINQIEAQLGVQIAGLPGWESLGLLGRIELLHELIFVDRRLALILFSVCWFLFFLILESLPLLSRMLTDFSEYDQCLEAERETLVSQFAQRIRNMANINLHQLTLAYQQSLLELQRKTALGAHQEPLDEIMDMFRYEMDTLTAFANEEKKINREVEDKYRHLTEEVYQRALRRIEGYLREAA